MEFDVGPGKFGGDDGDARFERDPAIGLRDLGGIVDPAQPRVRGAVRGLEIETRPSIDAFAVVRRLSAARLDPSGEIGAEGGKLGRRHRIRDQDVALGSELLRFRRCEKGHGDLRSGRESLMPKMGRDYRHLSCGAVSEKAPTAAIFDYSGGATWRRTNLYCLPI